MIKKWLNDKNRRYSDGLNIYNRAKKSAAKDKFFAQVQEVPSSDIHFIYLERELRYILRVYGDLPPVKTVQEPPPPLSRSLAASDKKTPSLPPIVVKPILPVKTVHAPSDVETVLAPSTNKPKFFDRLDPNTLPDDLRQLYEENKTLNRDISALHVNLKHYATLKTPEAIKKRQEIKELLLQKTEHKNKNYEAIDSWYNSVSVRSRSRAASDLIKQIKAAERYLQRNFQKTDPETINKCNQRKQFLIENGVPWKSSKTK
jgi:hypothetical protein